MNRMLYFHKGYLSDKGVIIDGKPIDTISSADGDSFYLWSVLYEFQNRGYETLGVINHDEELVNKYNKKAFESFSQEKRWEMYNKINFIGLEKALISDFPEVDIALLYWRMKTKDNQLEKNDINYSPDLEIQNNILNFYRDKKIKLRILDFDLQMTKEDEERILNLGYTDVKILDQSLFPNKKIINRETCYIPFLFEDMMQFETPICNRSKLISYCGNWYNREKDFEKIFKFAKNNPGRVHVYGNYMKDSLKEIRDKNSGVVFHDRIGFAEFRNAIGDAVCSTLLATESYKEFGNMTARILEVLLNGSIPVGFSDFAGIENWLPKNLIVDMKNYDESMNEVIDSLSRMPWTRRNKLRLDLIDKLSKMHDVKYFVDEALK